MNRYFLQLAYKGTNYHGWQIQPNANTVQAEINKGLSVLLKQEVSVMGCGRTDTGVHAKDFYLHFDTDQPIESTDDLLYKLNRILPFDIVIYQIWEMDENCHTRFDAISRTYQYFISPIKNPFVLNQAYYYPFDLKVEAMKEACQYLLGEKDFSAFSKSRTQTFTNNCHVMEARWFENEEGLLVFEIKADRFLRNMVRAMVGTLMDVGTGKIKPETVNEIILQKNRGKAGVSVPADGLFLTEVKYPENYFSV